MQRGNRTRRVKTKKRKGRKRRKKQQRGWGIKDLLNTAINKLPFELHWPGHQFTGPGTKLHKRLDSKDKPKSHSKPINRVDGTSMLHDICYRDNKNKKGRTSCDWQMVKRLRNIKKPNLREKVERKIIGGIIATKAALGV